jgi:hypothetical protein
MNTFRLLSLGFCMFTFSSLICQPENAIKALNFKLELMSDNQTWGVFVIPGDQISPSNKTSTGAGQITIVVPVGFSYLNLRNHGGTWVENARVNSPMEAPDKTYISFGFVTDEPKIMLYPNEETLLFTFTSTDLNNDIYLIDNVNDPFATPNSYGSNPGNDLGILDFGAQGGMQTYAYHQNVEMNYSGTGRSGFAKYNNNNGEVKPVFTKGSNEIIVKNPESRINE